MLTYKMLRHDDGGPPPSFAWVRTASFTTPTEDATRMRGGNYLSFQSQASSGKAILFVGSDFAQQVNCWIETSPGTWDEDLQNPRNGGALFVYDSGTKLFTVKNDEDAPTFTSPSNTYIRYEIDTGGFGDPTPLASVIDPSPIGLVYNKFAIVPGTFGIAGFSGFGTTNNIRHFFGDPSDVFFSDYDPDSMTSGCNPVVPVAYDYAGDKFVVPLVNNGGINWTADKWIVVVEAYSDVGQVGDWGSGNFTSPSECVAAHSENGLVIATGFTPASATVLGADAAGQVLVISRNDTATEFDWFSLGNSLIMRALDAAHGSPGDCGLGRSIALSRDGEWLVVGCPLSSNAKGRVFLVEKSNIGDSSAGGGYVEDEASFEFTNVVNVDGDGYGIHVAISNCPSSGMPTRVAIATADQGAGGRIDIWDYLPV